MAERIRAHGSPYEPDHTLDQWQAVAEGYMARMGVTDTGKSSAASDPERYWRLGYTPREYAGIVADECLLEPFV